MTVAYFVATQYDNLGDLLINRELINELGKHDKTYVDVTGAPEEFRNALLSNSGSNIEPLPLSLRSPKFYWQLITDKQRIRLVVFPPGAQSLVVPKAHLRSWLLQVLSLITLRIMGVGVCCFGISFDSRRPTFLGLIKWRLFNHVGIRDELSVRELRSVLPNASYCPDLALLHFVKEAPNCARGWGRYIVISARGNIPEKADAMYGQTLVRAVQLAASRIPEIETVVLVRQVGRDEHFMTEIKEAFISGLESSAGREIRIEALMKNLSLEELSAIYSGAEWVLSNRLHVLLLGALSGSKIIGLTHSSHSKLNDVLSDLGLAKAMVRIDQDVGKFVHDLDLALDASEDVQDSFLARRLALISRIRADIAKAMTPWGGGSVA